MKSTTAWIHLAVFAGGAAALSWEVIWQLQLALAIGVSAEGTALTLALTMGGMTLGSFFMGRILHGREISRPLRAYGSLEIVVGISGLLLRPALSLVAHADSALPADARFSIVQLVGILLVLGVPTFAMGASLPFFGLVAKQYRTRLPFLYGLNTLGAASGTLLIGFLILPALGVGWSILLVAALNTTIGTVAILLPPSASTQNEIDAAPKASAPHLAFGSAALIVFVTGFATFALEVAWFRALRAAFLSTTNTFAILLAAVLLPLAVASRFAVKLHSAGKSVGPWLAAAGVGIFLVTPIIERFDTISKAYVELLSPTWFVDTLIVVGPPMFLLGIALPWVLEDRTDTKSWGALYAVNTIGAIAGALASAWGLLPTLGFARTAWCVGALVVVAACASLRGRTLAFAASAGLFSLMIAIVFESGIGRTRTIGPPAESRLVAFRESADFTVSVVENKSGRRALYIDGFVATEQPPTRAAKEDTDYMVWMGRLPMLLHPDPKNGLVICFGTGQTANAVRNEGIASLDIVDISQAVFDMAGNFPANENVLGDPHVQHHRVDGRAWLRRTSQTYDVITLEPMPPTFAGVNALYSEQFYELIASRLNAGGIAVQWLPFHLVDPYRATSIAETFRKVFPDAVLWEHPVSGTGILLGCKAPCSTDPLGSTWPGLARESRGRTLTADDIKSGLLDNAETTRFAAVGGVVTDDNQLLAYGVDPRSIHAEQSEQNARANAKLVRDARAGDVKLPPDPGIPLRAFAIWFVLAAIMARVAYLAWRKVFAVPN